MIRRFDYGIQYVIYLQLGGTWCNQNGITIGSVTLGCDEIVTELFAFGITIVHIPNQSWRRCNMSTPYYYYSQFQL